MLSLPAGLSELDGLLEHPRPDFAPGKGPYSEMQQQSAVLYLSTHWLCSPKRHIRAWLRINTGFITRSLESLEWL